MKWLIYFLLICNIGFAAWHFRGFDSRKNITENEAELKHESQLILLSEFKQKEKDFLGGKGCYSLGPFYKKTQSKEAQKSLQQDKLEIKLLQLRDISRSGFWVTLPANKSRKAAKKHIDRLKKLKVTDYFLVATGDHQNAISLGVYSQKELARRRIDEIIRLGFSPRMESVPLPRKVYWLNWYKDLKQQPEESMLTKIKKQHPQISKIERSCK